MIEETAVRVEISAARFASQSIFDILRLTVQAMSSQTLWAAKSEHAQPAGTPAGIGGRE